MSEPTATILIVDDERPLARNIVIGLQHAGYRPVVANDGQGALAALEQEAVDLAVLDVGLPDMTGLEVCRRLRAQPRERYLPVLMLTAAASPQERLAGFAAGADDYVAKPFDLAELLARIGVWLGVRRREAALQAAVCAQQAARLAAEQRAAQSAATVRVAHALVHRMNQSLAEVVGYAELLLTDEQSAQQVLDYTQHIVVAGRELADLTRQFGDLAVLDNAAPAAELPPPVADPSIEG